MIIAFHLLNLITWHCGIDINKQLKILDFRNAVESISAETEWNIIHVKWNENLWIWLHYHHRCRFFVCIKYWRMFMRTQRKCFSSGQNFRIKITNCTCFYLSTNWTLFKWLFYLFFESNPFFRSFIHSFKLKCDLKWLFFF